MVHLTPALVLAMTTQNPEASNALMWFVLGILGLQAMVGIGCVAFAAWRPTRRWLAGFAQPR